METASATATALVESLGYEKAQEVVRKSMDKGITIRQVVVSEGLMDDADFEMMISPEMVTRLGSADRRGLASKSSDRRGKE